MFPLSFEEAEILRRRAEDFLENALKLLDEGKYDLAMFSLEQYCQLILKYKILIYKASYPRVHSLRRLIRELSDIKKDILDLVNNMDYLHYIARIEEAYIAARYLPYTYEEREVRDIIRFVLEVFKPYVEKI